MIEKIDEERLSLEIYLNGQIAECSGRRIRDAHRVNPGADAKGQLEKQKALDIQRIHQLFSSGMFTQLSLDNALEHYDHCLQIYIPCGFEV